MTTAAADAAAAAAESGALFPGKLLFLVLALQ